MVYGSRFLGRGRLARPPGMHPANWLANKLLSWSASILFARRVTDEATCYKLLERRLLLALDLRSERFDICPEITAKVLRQGHRIHEVPIAYRAGAATTARRSAGRTPSRPGGPCSAIACGTDARPSAAPSPPGRAPGCPSCWGPATSPRACSTWGCCRW